MLAAVEQFLTAPEEAPVFDAQALQDAVEAARMQVHLVGWNYNPAAHHRASRLLFVLGQLHLAQHGAPVIGTPWNFAAADPSRRARRIAIVSDPISISPAAPVQPPAARWRRVFHRRG